MIVKVIKFDYSETRNVGNYNSFRVGAGIEAALEPGESREDALAAASSEIIAFVRTTKKQRIAKLRGDSAI